MSSNVFSVFSYSGGGADVTLTYSVTALYGNVGNVFALLQAIISKSLFQPYHNIESLTQKFPDRISIQGTHVVIQGPVLISDGGWWNSFSISSAMSLGLVLPVTFLAYKVFNSIFLPADSDVEKKHHHKKAMILTALVGAATFIGATTFLMNRIPSTAGIHLLDWTLRKIN